MDRWIEYNPNPCSRRVGDCAIRACCKATNRTWNEVFDALVQIAYRQKDVLSANKVWGEYLSDNGYVRYEPDYPMDVYKFCCNFPRGTYVLGLDALEDFMCSVSSMVKQICRDADCREEREIVKKYAREIAEM